jgi:CDP-diglyceride synthetase
VSSESRLMAGILLILLPTVVFGGTSILSMLIGDPEYAQNQLRQDLWRAGHAHAGVLLVLSLVTLRYVDEAALSGRMKRLVRHSIPAAAILLPVAFFLSVLSPAATEPNAMIYLAYVGAISLTLGLLVLGIGLIRERSGAAEHGAIDVVERDQSQ